MVEATENFFFKLLMAQSFFNLKLKFYLLVKHDSSVGIVVTTGLTVWCSNPSGGEIFWTHPPTQPLDHPPPSTIKVEHGQSYTSAMPHSLPGMLQDNLLYLLSCYIKCKDADIGTCTCSLKTINQVTETFPLLFLLQILVPINIQIVSVKLRILNIKILMWNQPRPAELWYCDQQFLWHTW